MSDRTRWRIVVAVGTVACAEPLASAPAAGDIGTSHAALIDGPAVVADPEVTVSLTFDDTDVEQRDAAGVLDAHGLPGTFYVNSPRLHQGSAGRGAWLTVDDVRSLQARGHEIGGHTLSHPNLTSLPEAEQRLQISGDRRELLRLGLDARSLAYPNGDVEAGLDPAEGPSLPEVVEEAGYGSARDTNGFSLRRCGAGPETLPPQNDYRLRSTRSVNNRPPSNDGLALPPDTADTLLGWMDHAASCGGGYLPLIFHQLRPDCSGDDSPTYCFELPEFDRLAEALATGERCFDAGDGERCYRVAVATVSAALGDTALPEAPEVFALRNPSLERTLGSGSTECLQRRQGSQGTAQFARLTGVARSGEASEHMEIPAPYVSSAELVVPRDFGTCAHFTSVGASYDLALHYRADPDEPAPMLRFIVHRLTTDYRWVQFSVGARFVAATPGSWVRSGFSTGAVPDGTLALSFGLRLESVGGVSVDDFEIAPGTGG